LDDGRLFYAMRFIRGNHLEAEIDALYAGGGAAEQLKGKHKQTFNWLLRQLVSAAKTIAYAHKRLILNLDIKPRNIMVGKYGETVVVDWGESIPIDEESFTHLETAPVPVARKQKDRESGSSLVGGTLPYMAPERMPCQSGEIGPATDIYSLGVCLYRILTGQEAFTYDLAPRDEVIRRIECGDYPRPSQVNPRVPRGLEAICCKAMALRTTDRYCSALEFAQDIERYLDDEPVRARRESPLEKAGRWSRQNKTATAAAVACMIIALLLACGAAITLGQAWDAASDARRQNLHLSAESTASLVARDFEYRWRALESMADAPELIQKIEDVDQWKETNGKVELSVGPQTALQSYLETLHEQWKVSAQAASMLVLDRDGIMIARAPQDRRSKEITGTSFRFRDYYHGHDKDYDREEAEADHNLAPISHPHVSVALKSRLDGLLRVQFSVPVRNQHGQTIAVLGMAVRITQFDLPKTDRQRPLVLLDLRETQIEGTPRDNLIVSHPAMQEDRLKGIEDAWLVDRLRRLRDDSQRMGDNGEALSVCDEAWSDDYVDPLVGGCWHAAFAPIRVRVRKTDSRLETLDLIVIAQERGG
jgi:hypothetical protein